MSKLFGRSEQGMKGILWSVYEGENEDYTKARLVASFSDRIEAWDYMESRNTKSETACDNGDPLLKAQARVKVLTEALDDAVLRLEAHYKNELARKGEAGITVNQAWNDYYKSKSMRVIREALKEKP